MKKETITKLAVAAIFAVASVESGFSQTNLGASCGCPPVNSRPTVLVSTLAVSGGSNDGSLTATTTIFDCSKTWILDKKIFVDNGKTLIIQPGTVIKGRKYSTPDSSTCLIVSRGAKILANGTPDCQIVLTAEADPMDGSFPIANKGQWGGLVIAGRATNNLTLAANGPFVPFGTQGKLCIADGLGIFEGFASSDSRLYFGANLTNSEVFDDNDNSGIVRYLSVRHAGAILQVGGEINGISLGSVGRGTTIEHVDVVSSADDGMELWGGTVNIKYASFLFGNDDNFDWDDGYSGKAQFLFALQTDTTAIPDADNGFEMDADDQKSNLLPRSHPVIYNVTMIGNGKHSLTTDNSGLAAIEAKELTEGEIYNSIFANFRYGFNVIKTFASPRTQEVWANWANSGGNGSNSLKIKCNAFVNCIHPFAVDKNATGGFGSTTDTAQFYTTDKNVAMASVPGFDFAWAVNDNTNIVSHQVDVIPNPALSTTGCPVTPTDGFFSPTTYKGAFASTGQNWLSNWSYAALISAVGGTAACPTDINQDGITNNADFLLLLGQFNVSCQ